MIIKIFGKLKTIKEDNPAEGLFKGDYLYFYSDKSNFQHRMLLSEFFGRYEKAKRGIEPMLSEPGVKIDGQENILSEKKVLPDYGKIIKYLTEKMAITTEEFSDNDELIIESGFGSFLELPWEEITSKKIIVLRKVPVKNTDCPNSTNNLLFVISNSHITPNGKMPDLKEKLTDEILDIMRQVIHCAPKDYKIDKINVSKHTTRNSFRSLPWESHNYVHIIMHGNEDGGIALEDSDLDKYKIQDVMSIDETLEILTDKKFLLMFLSFCYSGGGLNDNKNSLAFRLVNKGISKYVIGYRFGIGEDSALNFSEIFYKILLNGLNSIEKSNIIENAYKKSLSEYYKNSTSDNKYLPVLYANI